jgi:hypothetical protein
MASFSGGCACGAIRFEFEGGEPAFAGRCYCRDCQYAARREPTVAIAVYPASTW